MKWRRRFLRVLLGLIVLFDFIVFMQFHTHGWPSKVILRDLGAGRAAVSVERIPFSTEDWLIGALLVSIQGVVVYANFRTK
jgi:hypothetical protein